MSVDATLTEQRIIEAASATKGSVVTGWAALRMHGGAFFDGRAWDRLRPVQLRVPPDCHHRPRPGSDLVRGEVDTVVWIRGVPCTPVRQALLDAMRLRDDLREAVVDIDMAAAAHLTSVARMTGYLERRTWRGVPGVPQVRRALALADEASASPQETRLRLVWELDAGLPRPLVNVPVFDPEGRLLGYPDLLDVEAGLAVEYDGADHRDSGRHSDDVDREAGFRAAGLEVTRATGRDVRQRDQLVGRLRAARARSPFTPSATRGWTVTPPPWFRPSMPVDLVLDHRGIDL